MGLLSILQTINKIFKDKLPKETIEIIKQYYLSSCYKLIIDVANNKQFLSVLIDYIDKQTMISHILLNDLPYYGGPDDEDQPLRESRPTYDPVTECYLCEKIIYARQDQVKSKYKKEYKIEVQYDDKLELVIDRDMTFEPFNKEEYDGHKKRDINLLEKIHKIDPHEILLSGYNRLIIQNTSKFNKDHRGADHCQILLPWNDIIIKKRPITLYELMQYYYELKSHKFDKGYESFNGAENITTGKNIRLEIAFDHGS